MARGIQDIGAAVSKDCWPILVVCEDELAHARALSLCERLAHRFGDEIEFRFSWWLFANLEYAVNAGEAARAASQAEMVFFVTHEREELPYNLKSWIETWVNQREPRGGALVSLTCAGKSVVECAPLKNLYLREVARRAEMDFLSNLPENLAHGIPESADWFSARASALGPVMEGILQHTGGPAEPPPY
jgi:hypothetical protein